jgi:hypothetical protein
MPLDNPPGQPVDQDLADLRRRAGLTQQALKINPPAISVQMTREELVALTAVIEKALEVQQMGGDLRSLFGRLKALRK